MPNLGGPEVLILILVLLLLFGAKKLPELARGSGRALRIFKAETKGLMTEEDDGTKTEEQRAIDAQRAADSSRLQAGSSAAPPAQPTYEARDTER